MRRQAAARAANNISEVRSLPAPIGGWNAKDSIAAMPPTDAVLLDNFFPVQEGVKLRKGSANFASVPAGSWTRSLLPFQSSTGTWKLFAGTQNGIFNVTPGGAVLLEDTPTTNGEWQHVNFSNAAGNFLWICNGVDDSRYYNGTAWTVLNALSTPALTGITSSSITNALVFKQRIYLCKKDSLSFWYLPVNAVAGEAREFPLGAVFTRGGYLMALGAWSLDGGNGPEDYFVAFSSEGEMAVYAGTDPSNAATWGLQGLYYIAEPIGRKCLLKYGGDLLALTVQGLIPVSKALQSPVVDARIGITDKISQAWVAYARDFKQNYGWQSVAVPNAPFLLTNVPVVLSETDNVQYSYQFVMNLQTGAWCRFLGMPAEAWCYVGQRLFFAKFNKINEAWVGASDVEGFPIDARCKTAFQYPGNASRNHIKMLRPVIATSGTPLKLQLGIDHDFKNSELSGSEVTYGIQASLWDSSNWDQAIWSDTEVVTQWKSVAHIPGRALALRLRILGKDVNMTWNTTDFILQQGRSLL